MFLVKGAHSLLFLPLADTSVGVLEVDLDIPVTLWI